MKLLVIARKEMRSIINEKTLLLAVLIQLFIASFAAFLVVGIFSYIAPEALAGYNMPKVNLIIVAADEENELVKYIQAENKFRIFFAPKFKDAVEQFYLGKVDGVLVLSEEKEEGREPLKVDIYLPKTDIKATLIVAYLKRPLEKYESKLREARAARLSGELRDVMAYSLPLPPHKTASTYFEFVYGVLIPLLVLAPAFISGGLIIDLITEETEKKTLSLLLVSPVSLLSVLNGKILVAAVIAPIQAFLWLLLLKINGVAIYNMHLIVLFSFLTTLILVLLSSMLSLHYRNRGTSHFVYSLILINLFFASFFFQFSPMGLVTKLALDSVLTDLTILAYALLTIFLYLYFKDYITKKQRVLSM